jgi:hypothetical protein
MMRNPFLPRIPHLRAAPPSRARSTATLFGIGRRTRKRAAAAVREARRTDQRARCRW